MHVFDLMELGALTAVFQEQLAPTDDLCRHDLEEYWVASKCRLDRWARSFRDAGTNVSNGGDFRATDTFQATLVEILVSELLTRVWSAVLCGQDERRGVVQASPIAHSIFQGHLEARHRVLGYLARDAAPSVSRRMQLDRIRRRSELWSDILLAHTRLPNYIPEFAVDAQRAMRYARDFQGRDDPAEHQWPRLISSLRLAFQSEHCATNPNSDLNRRIASSILATFVWPQIAGIRLPPRLSMERVERLAFDCSRMLDDALREDV